MRIGIEANAMYRNWAGTGTYARNLFSAMRRVEPHHTYLFLSRSTEPCGINVKKRALVHRLINGVKDILWTQIALPGMVLSNKVDIFHAPAFISPVWTSCPKVITVLDLTVLRYPETFDRLWRLYAIFNLRWSLRRAEIIIAISESTRKDIVELSGVSPGRVRVVYLGLDQRFRPLNDRTRFQDVCDKFRISGPFILNVGTLEPRKNIPRLLRAFSIFKERQNDDHYRLVIAGERGWLYEEIFREVESLGLKEDVVFTGYIEQAADLSVLYNAADLLVYPSLYEGFGLPPLEAMACGCPVITSNSSSLPEVVGDSAILVDPYDVEGLAQAILEVLASPALRETMSRKGKERARLFSWEKAARETLSLYREVAGGSSPSGSLLS